VSLFYLEDEMKKKIVKEAATDESKRFKVIDPGKEKAAIDKETRTVEVIVSSQKQDRDGDIILQKGIDHSHATSVLWGHNYGRDGQLPIAKILEAKIATRKGTKVTIEKHQFPDEGTYQLADDIFNLIQEGVITSTSIGFIPKKTKRPETEEEREKLGLGPYGVLFEAIEKLETSWVPVPANREAVILAHEKGLVKSKIEDFFPDEGEEIEKSGAEKPYENEHACRLKDPGKYDRFTRKNCAQKHDGKCIDVIYGIKEGKSEIQALRYPKDIWTASAAKSHCKDRNGTFEAAKGFDNEKACNDLGDMINGLERNTAEMIDKVMKYIHRIEERLELVEESAQNKKPEIDENALSETLQGMAVTPTVIDSDFKTAVRTHIRNAVITGGREILDVKSGKVDISKLKFKRRS
jgi:hypothetical protein